MKSFKQFLRESEETKDHISENEEAKELDEAKMDWGNVMNEVTNTSLLVDIINKHSKPEIRVGDSSYVIKDLENPETLNSIRKKYGSISKLTDEQEEELKQDNINFDLGASRIYYNDNSIIKQRLLFSTEFEF